jgi:hypothetical protein
MELKRYVLLNKNVIYDTKDFDDVKKFSMVKNSSHLDYQVKATSDNVLDLVEVGDLVESRNMILRVSQIRGKQFESEHFGISDFQVISIYKRKPNGDYKKYEVKGE